MAEARPYPDPFGWDSSHGCSPGCGGSCCACQLACWRPAPGLEESYHNCCGRVACPGSWSDCRLSEKREDKQKKRNVSSSDSYKVRGAVRPFNIMPGLFSQTSHGLCRQSKCYRDIQGNVTYIDNVFFNFN